MIIITSKHFCAAVILDEDNTVINAAPILRYMMGWNEKKVINYSKSKHWITEQV